MSGSVSTASDRSGMTTVPARRRRPHRTVRGRARRGRCCRPFPTLRPALARMCAVSAVVVDLPLVPVMPIDSRAARDAADCASGSSASWRKNNSVSPITSTPAAVARSTVQCGFGCVSGTPGDSTRAANWTSPRPSRSVRLSPCCPARSRDASPSSQAATVAPPATSAWAAAMPERARPNTATVRPANIVTGIMRRS